ncbi:lysylphosphatidylglycerol synthase transmembrane domain-containing protein [Kitasatospora sp. McL0602]|uniref:lysylphosphatidylglycerol synthase transmembrane domain-containing protein n=1 Tax=Kitasatospora sp. McL0602 TaxID=3439530 RepID=UPI003F886C9C
MATVIQDDTSTSLRTAAENVRVRHPASLVRALTGLAAAGLTLLLATGAQGTADGLDADVAQGTEQVPWALGGPAGLLAAVALLVLPLAFAGQRLARRAHRGLADGVAAAVLAYGLSLALDAAVGGLAALTHTNPGGVGRTDPVYGHLAPVLAFMTTAGAARLPRWRTALAVTLGVAGLSGLVTGYATPLSLVLALLIGWAAGHATTYALGTPACRPTTAQLLIALGQAGVRPHLARRTAPGRYLVTQHDGRPDLDVLVLDPRAQTSGWPGHLWRLLRLRAELTPRGLLPPRTGLEHEALLAYAATAAGVRTRQIAATAQLAPDSTVVAYHYLPGRAFGELAEEELTDELLTDAWQQLQLLQRRRTAHRAISADALLIAPDGAVHLVGLSDGEIAAGELQLHLDVAGMLSTLALRAGAEPAVRTGTTVLGAPALCAALPLLQPIALAPGSRAALKAQPELLGAVRESLLRDQPQAEVQPVRLERLRPRTLLTVGAGLLAGYLLLRYLLTSDRDPFAVLSAADPFWFGLAAGAAALSYLAATLGFVGFVPERLHFGRALAVQVAGAFAKLVSPGGVGGVALNTRFLQCGGVPTPQALSSVGVSQLGGLALHLLQLAFFAALLGRAPQGEMPSARVLAVGAVLLCAVVVSGFAVPWVRRRIGGLLRPLRAEVLPRLLDLLQQPGKLALGVAGQLLVSLAFITCLYCCALAVGQQPGYAAVAVAFLAGNALGSAAPTPGGAGVVDVLLVTALRQMAGMDEGAAFAAVTLYRLLTFLLPVLPGWAAFAWLQRRRAL